MSSIASPNLPRDAYARDTYVAGEGTIATGLLTREAGYAILRLTFGIIFLFAGIGKFLMGVDAFASGLASQFAGKLPTGLVIPFGYALPFVEVTIGTLLVLGLFSRFALVLSGLLLAGLTFGTIVGGDTATAAHNVQYALVNFALLWLADYNGISIDRLLRKRG